MLAQLTLKHGEVPSKDSVICRSYKDMWLYKRQDFIDWEYLTFYNPPKQQENDVQVFKVALIDLNRLNPFIQNAFQKGYSFESISREYDSIFEFKLHYRNEYYTIKQQYIFNEKGWKLRELDNGNYFPKNIHDLSSSK